MAVTFHLDPARRRAVAIVPPGTRWADFHAAVLAAVEQAPELTDWNWIIDDQGPMDDVEVAAMVRTGEAFRRLAATPERRTFTIVITTDRYFATWARVIDLNYGNREHHAAPTMADAVALMDRLESGVAAAGSGGVSAAAGPPRGTGLRR